MRSPGRSAATAASNSAGLAEDYAELRHYEKAIDAMRTAMRAGEDAMMGMNLIGNWYGRLQDRERE